MTPAVSYLCSLTCSAQLPRGLQGNGSLALIPALLDIHSYIYCTMQKLGRQISIQTCLHDNLSHCLQENTLFKKRALLGFQPNTAVWFHSSLVCWRGGKLSQTPAASSQKENENNEINKTQGFYWIKQINTNNKSGDSLRLVCIHFPRFRFLSTV